MAVQELGPYQEAWVLTLESGLHRQGRERLCQKAADGEWAFCCLGLACEVVVQNGQMSAGHSRRRDGTMIWVYGGQDEMLPARVKSLLCFRDVDGGFDLNEAPQWVVDRVTNGAQKSGTDLVALNDIYGFTFADIAQFVRECPSLIFTGPA